MSRCTSMISVHTLDTRSNSTSNTNIVVGQSMKLEVVVLYSIFQINYGRAQYNDAVYSISGTVF